MKILVSHPTGNQFVRTLVKTLSEKDLLCEFDTTIAANPDAAWIKLLPQSLRKEWLRRTYPVPSDKLRSYPFLELARMVSLRAGLGQPVKHETGWASVDAVYSDLDNKVAGRLKKLRPDAVYGYEDGVISSFREAKKLNIPCLYDLPIGYWRAARVMLKAELERWPDWAATITSFHDSELKLARKDEELLLADKIFVASKFTARTLGYFNGKLAPVTIVPYGFPPVIKSREYTNISASRPLKLIFVGGLSQRKGIADLFSAVKIFGNKVSLTVVGNKTGDDCAVLDEELAKHRWIPSLPHQQVLDLMREHDVLIFPSLFEGFGLVITEAMAQGTPVITTDRTAGPDVIEHDENGWLIEAGSTERLTAAIEKLLSDPGVVGRVGRAAMEAARKRPWEKYGKELVDAIIR